VNGQAIETRGHRMPFRFAVGTKPAVGVTPEFAREVRKVVELASKKDFAGAHFHAEWMLAEKTRLLYEFAALKATMANTYADIGEVHTALAASREATTRSSMSLEEYVPGGPFPRNSEKNYVLSRGVTSALLRLRFRLDASLGFMLDAANAYAELQGLGDLAADDPFIGYGNQVIDALTSGKDLVGKARLGDKGTWTHVLYRDSFTLADINGKVESLYLQCAGRSRQIPFVPDVDWSVPASWGRCGVVFAGNPGSTFTIIEVDAAALDSPAPR
jgi:hypothetical protein